MLRVNLRLPVNFKILFFIFTILLSATPAQAAKPSVSSSTDRLACMEQLAKDSNYESFDDLHSLRRADLISISQCNFSEFGTILNLEVALGKTKAGAEAARSRHKLTLKESQAAIEPAQRELDKLLATFNLALASIREIDSVRSDPHYQAYADAVSRVIRMSPSDAEPGLAGPGLKVSDLISNYSAYGALELSELAIPGPTESCSLDERAPSCTFNFRGHVLDENDSFSVDTTYPFDFPLRQETNDFARSGKLCAGECRDYVELLLFARVWHAFWLSNSEVMYVDTLKKISDSLSEYDNFFFEAGDGLYPWELWVNSRGKSDDIFSVPNKKWNLIHPSPIVYYSDNNGGIDPSILVEVLGVTWLNYSSGDDGSMPFGLAAVADFENDQIRYGGMIHLPLRGGLRRLGFDTAAKLVPCEVCSIAFVTDGDGDWSVGVKVNVAQLLFDKEASQKLYQSFLKN